MAIGAVAGGALAGIMIGRNLEASRKGIAAAKETWKALEPRGFALSIESTPSLTSPATKERPVLTGNVGDTTVVARIHVDAVQSARTEITAARATAATSVVGVHPNPGGVFGYLRGWIGQDIEIGDEAFDAAYLITGKPESAAASLLVDGVRQLVASLGDRLAGFTITGTASRVVLAGVVEDPEIIGAAISLAAAGATWVDPGA